MLKKTKVKDVDICGNADNTLFRGNSKSQKSQPSPTNRATFCVKIQRVVNKGKRSMQNRTIRLEASTI